MFFLVPAIQSSRGEQLPRAGHCVGTAVDLGPLCIHSKIPDQSDSTVKSNVPESILGCCAFFKANFPDGFSLLKVYLEKGHLAAFTSLQVASLTLTVVPFLIYCGS